jgi:hypothetical protein
MLCNSLRVEVSPLAKVISFVLSFGYKPSPISCRKEILGVNNLVFVAFLRVAQALIVAKNLLLSFVVKI